MIPDGFEARVATEADAPAVTELVNATTRRFLGDDADEETPEDTLAWWKAAGADAELLVVHEGARLAAFALAEPHGDHVFFDGYVHPDRVGRGLGTALATFGERVADGHDPPRARTGILAQDEAAQRLFAARGYEYVRSFYRMVIDLADRPPLPVWPAGCTPEQGADRDLHAVVSDAFRDNWGHLERPFDEWLERVRAAQPDPSLSWIVRCDGEPAAAIICAERRFGSGHVGLLGVRPAFRRRGLARALLALGFRELFDRGERRIGLGVDAQSRTGATRLYESAGMRVALQADVLDRAG